MKILVLGASGYLGSKIYNTIKCDDKFEILGAYCNSNNNCELIKLDVNDEKSTKDIIENFHPEVVVWSLINNIHKNRSQKYLSHEQKIIFISTNSIFKGGSGYYKEEDKPQYRNCND